MSFPVSVLLMVLMTSKVLLFLWATVGVSFGVAPEDSILMTQVYITPVFFPHSSALPQAAPAAALAS